VREVAKRIPPFQLVAHPMTPIVKLAVTFHLRNLGATNGRAYGGRRAIIETLGRNGVRASELCDLRIGEVRLHDPNGARFRIPDAKTEAGVREARGGPTWSWPSRTSLASSAGPAIPSAQTHTRSRTRVGTAARASGSERSCTRQPRPPRQGSNAEDCNRCRSPRRTRCDAPTSRSRCWPTASTSSGS